MKELIERLETAAGPLRSLDAAIFEAAHGRSAYHETVPYRAGAAPARRMLDVPAFTSSIDAALTLIDERCNLVQLRHMAPDSWYAEVGDKIDDEKLYPGEARNGATAVCLAALRARADYIAS